MAVIAICKDYLAICGRRTIQVYSLRDGSKVHEYVDQTTKTDEEIKEAVKDTDDSSENQACNCKFSKSANYFAFCTVDKRLVVFQTSNWVIKHTWSLVKRPTGVDIDDFGQNVLVSDKSGDVYSYNMDLPSQNSQGHGKIILGHVSMLLGIHLSDDGKYLVTADRDETIRINHYPNAYNIAMYCHGHIDFVASIEFVQSDQDMLLSGGGDGCLILWNTKTGKCLSKVDLSSTETSTVIIGIASFKDDVFAICEGVTRVYHFKIKNSSLLEAPSIDLDLSPWSIKSSSVGIILLLGNENQGEIRELDVNGKQVDGPVTEINSQLMKGDVLKNIDWTAYKYSELRRFGKRKEVNGFLYASAENPPVKAARKEDTLESQ